MAFRLADTLAAPPGNTAVELTVTMGARLVASVRSAGVTPLNTSRITSPITATCRLFHSLTMCSSMLDLSGCATADEVIHLSISGSGGCRQDVDDRRRCLATSEESQEGITC